jgi:hypothetical protein
LPPAADRENVRDGMLTWLGAASAAVNGDTAAVNWIIGTEPDPRAMLCAGLAAYISLAEDLAALWRMALGQPEVSASAMIETVRQSVISQP